MYKWSWDEEKRQLLKNNSQSRSEENHEKDEELEETIKYISGLLKIDVEKLA